MKKLLALMGMGVAFAMGPGGCTTSEPGTESPAAATDASLRRDVLARLDDDAITAPLNLGVSCEGGVVTLTGRVMNAAARARAVSVARGTPGVKGVVENFFAR